jgi:transcriptional regulator with XRE-family HTH domain
MKRAIRGRGQTRGMPPAERARDRGRRTTRLLIADIATELREARLVAGLSQAAVARAAGTSQSNVSRMERQKRPTVSVDEVARHAAALGLRLSAKLYPEGPAVRDAGQLRLIARLRGEVNAQLEWRTEALIGGPGDLRAWDVRLDGPGSIGIDAETHLRDVQAVQRRFEAKWRDGGVDRIVFVIARTRHNLAVLSEYRDALRSTFPADTREILHALRRGRLPERNGIVLL